MGGDSGDLGTLLVGKGLGSGGPSLATGLGCPCFGGFWVRVGRFACRNVCDQLGELVCVPRALWFFGGVCHASNIAWEGGRPKGRSKILKGKLRHYPRFGGLDILVNNAGLATFHGIGEPEYEKTWTLALDVMLTAHMRFVRAALPALKKSGEGRVVNVASTEGFGATPGNSPYVAAKHGVIGLTRALAVELGREGVTVNCICPGPIRTGITAEIPDEHKEIFAKRRVPLRRYGFPEEVAHVTLSVVLPASSYLNGVAIPVDGGMLVKNA